MGTGSLNFGPTRKYRLRIRKQPYAFLRLVTRLVVLVDLGQLNLGLAVPSPSSFHTLKRSSPKETCLSMPLPPCFCSRGKEKLLKELLLVAHEIVSHLCGRVIWPLKFVQSGKGDGWGWGNSNAERSERTKCSSRCWSRLLGSQRPSPSITILLSNKSLSRPMISLSPAHDTERSPPLPVTLTCLLCFMFSKFFN